MLYVGVVVMFETNQQMLISDYNQLICQHPISEYLTSKSWTLSSALSDSEELPDWSSHVENGFPATIFNCVMLQVVEFVLVPVTSTSLQIWNCIYECKENAVIKQTFIILRS